jgi:formylglycine-generating enzyme
MPDLLQGDEAIPAPGGVPPASPDTIWIPGGTFRMGSDRHYPEEAPVHRVAVDGFWMDAKPVSNRAFAAFVAATGHVTNAEIPPDPRDYPGAKPEMLFAGSLAFRKTRGPVDLSQWSLWWEFRRGAWWREPYGPGSSIDGLADHPVVHVAYADALSYARWAGKDLPTEAEWEFAARGGLDGAAFAWGDAMRPGGRIMANTWQGAFPYKNTREDGWEATSPIGTFPPNGYGLFDMIGNVWEWTQDFWAPRHAGDAPKTCCIPRNPMTPRASIRRSPRSASRAACSRAAASCVPRIIAVATVRRPAMRRRWTPPPAMSGSAAWCGRRHRLLQEMQHEAPCRRSRPLVHFAGRLGRGHRRRIEPLPAGRL